MRKEEVRKEIKKLPDNVYRTIKALPKMFVISEEQVLNEFKTIFKKTQGEYLDERYKEARQILWDTTFERWEKHEIKKRKEKPHWIKSYEFETDEEGISRKIEVKFWSTDFFKEERREVERWHFEKGRMPILKDNLISATPGKQQSTLLNK